MATIGLDSLFYAKITEDALGNETYATPKVLAKAISADLSFTRFPTLEVGNNLIRLSSNITKMLITPRFRTL